MALFDAEGKSDKDAAQWLCWANRTWYVETQIYIKAKHGLGATAAERSAMTRGAQYRFDRVRPPRYAPAAQWRLGAYREPWGTAGFRVANGMKHD